MHARELPLGKFDRIGWWGVERIGDFRLQSLRLGYWLDRLTGKRFVPGKRITSASILRKQTRGKQNQGKKQAEKRRRFHLESPFENTRGGVRESGFDLPFGSVSFTRQSKIA